ncbi:MAG: hypothetical protein WAT93_11810 [Pontixanthobacter sp.]
MNDNMTVGARLGQIYSEAQRLFMSSMPAAALYIGGLTAFSTVVDVNGWNSGGDQLVNFAALGFGFYLIKQILENAGLAPDGIRNGLWSYFGLGLLSGIGIAVGLVLLVLPGLFLLVRWMPAYGFSFADGETVTDSLGKSWEATRTHFWPLAIAALLPMGGYVAAVAILLLGADAAENMSLPVALIANLVLYSSSALFTAIGLAAYSLLAQPDNGLEEVFG